MKTKLSPADRAFVQSLVELLLEANNRNDRNSWQSSTYGTIHEAISRFVKNQTGIDISNGGGRHGWNLSGNATYADDIQAVIDFEFNRIASEVESLPTPPDDIKETVESFGASGILDIADWADADTERHHDDVALHFGFDKEEIQPIFNAANWLRKAALHKITFA